jgi:hypothetical protein
MKKTLLLFIAFSFGLQFSTKAQSGENTYNSAIGLKLLDGVGVTYKHFLEDNKAIEAIGFFWNRGTRITGLYEFHFDINELDGLKWYVGPGAHVSLYNTKYGGGTTIGLDGVLGLDYKISSLPLNLSVDWQPSYEFGLGRGFVGSWGGLGVRYTF